MNKKHDMYDVALKYVALGFCVLPVRKGEKRPLVNWKEYQTQKPDSSEIYEWFYGKTQDDIGIGLVSGKVSGVIVLDNDYHDGDKHNFDSPMVVRSGGNGFHVYYKYKDDLKNRTVIENDSIDLRNNAHFVVLPPTIHPNGTPYKWEINGKLSDLISVLPEPPQVFSEVETKKVLQDKNIIGTQKGNREPTLSRIAMSLRMRHTPDEIALAILRGSNANFNPPHEDRIVIEAWKKTLTQYEAKTGTKWIAEQEKQVPTTRTLESLREERKKLRELEKKAKTTGFNGLDAIIGGFKPTLLSVLTGETNAGKTSLACNMAYWNSCAGSRVLYLALEPDLGILDFFTALHNGVGFNDITDDMDYPENIEILLNQDCQNIEQLKEIIANNADRFDLIIIDHIGYFVMDGNDYVRQQANLLKQIKQFCFNTKSHVMCIAHPRKRSDMKARISMNDINGSVAFKQDANEVFILQRDEIEVNGQIEQDSRAFLEVAKKKTFLKKSRGIYIEFMDGNPMINEVRDSVRSDIIENF